MASSRPTQNQSLITEAFSQAKDYIGLLKEWISKRELTISEIQAIAKELHDEKPSVSMTREVGGALADGGDAAVAGTKESGEVAGTEAGGAPSVGAEIATKYVSKSTQKPLQDDAALLKKIEDVRNTLDSKIRDLSRSQGLSFEQVQGALFMATMIRGVFVHENPVQFVELLTSSKPIAAMLNTSFEKDSKITKDISTSLADVSEKGTVKTAEKVLTGMMLVWDLVSLVTSSVDRSKGSPSDASKSLENIASELTKHVNNVNDLLKEIRNQTEDFERKIRDRFHKLLENASAIGYSPFHDTQEIIEFMKLYSSPEWQQAFHSLNVDLNEFAFQIARVFQNIKQPIEDEVNRSHPHQLTITIIAHGRIDPRTEVPCSIYYFNHFKQLVTLYSPWGCAIDASVVYGIATNTISPPNVNYSAPVQPGIPKSWNMLPRVLTLTPNIKFTPVRVGEDAHQALMELDRILRTEADGLVIPYFTGLGNDLLPFPEIQLWTFANVVGMCAQFYNVSMNLRVAACLSPEDTTLTASMPGGYLQGLTQYCQVPMNLKPAAMMTNNLTYEQRTAILIDRLNQTLPL